MKSAPLLISVAAVLCSRAVPQVPQVPSPNQQIAAAVLPLPEVMRAGAGVQGYGPDLSLITLRPSKNGMMCTAIRPGADTFDVRCYHESFLPIIRRLGELFKQGKSAEGVYRTIDSEIKARKLTLPDHPTAGYRMLGPISAYNAATNSVGKEVESWQSIHIPYKTAAEIGLPEEGAVARTTPYVMASGTIWSHVMIEHEQEALGQASEKWTVESGRNPKDGSRFQVGIVASFIAKPSLGCSKRMSAQAGRLRMNSDPSRPQSRLRKL